MQWVLNTPVPTQASGLGAALGSLPVPALPIGALMQVQAAIAAAVAIAPTVHATAPLMCAISGKYSPEAAATETGTTISVIVQVARTDMSGE